MFVRAGKSQVCACMFSILLRDVHKHVQYESISAHGAIVNVIYVILSDIYVFNPRVFCLSQLRHIMFQDQIAPLSIQDQIHRINRVWCCSDFLSL